MRRPELTLWPSNVKSVVKKSVAIGSVSIVCLILRKKSVSYASAIVNGPIQEEDTIPPSLDPLCLAAPGWDTNATGAGLLTVGVCDVYISQELLHSASLACKKRSLSRR